MDDGEEERIEQYGSVADKKGATGCSMTVDPRRIDAVLISHH